MWKMLDPDTATREQLIEVARAHAHGSTYTWHLRGRLRAGHDLNENYVQALCQILVDMKGYGPGAEIPDDH